MMILSNCIFAENINQVHTSPIYYNSQGDILSVQIDGANGIYHIEGRSRNNGEWFPLVGLNLSDLSIVKGIYTKPGIYELGITSIREIRARIESIDGKVNIFGQIINSQEA